MAGDKFRPLADFLNPRHTLPTNNKCINNMGQKLILVDYENIQKIDLSLLDDSYHAIIFVGSSQNPPRASKNKATAHRFSRVDFQKIQGNGKNALDFHIAFQLGRTIETAPKTECIVLSKRALFTPTSQTLWYRRVYSDFTFS